MVDAQVTIDRMRRTFSIFSRLGSVGLLAIFMTACTVPPPDKGRGEAANSNPVLAPLAAEIAGKWVRMARPGATVEVRAHASDADGDKLRYRWIPAPGSGTVKSIRASTVRWTVGAGKAGNRLHVVVSDGKGGHAKETLRLPTRSEVIFSGRVVSNIGKPIADASVGVADESTTTDAKGFFKLPIEKAEAPRFVLNIRKWGYGLVSRVYDKSVHNGTWVMIPGTVETVDPRQKIFVRDTGSQSSCTGSLTSGIDWNNYPQQRIPRIIDTFGQLGGGTIPNDITQALNIILGGTACSPGISISIPPNSLVDAAGNPPAGNAEVAVSTVDIYAPDSMPGDYTVRIKDGARWMQSYGAGGIDIRAGGKALQLKPGASAQLTIPVDPTQLKMRENIPPTMPLLLYDADSGEWTLKGHAALNANGKSYSATIDHLSEFNTDLIKVDQACIRFRGDSLISAAGNAGEFELDAIIPLGNAAPVVRNWDISSSNDPLHASDPNLHAIINLPSNTWITLVPMRQEAGGLVPYGIFGINSGPPQTPTDPNFPPHPYLACQNEVTLTDVSGALDIVVDATGDTVGQLPVHYFALTAPDGLDIYPLNPVSGAFSLYGLYDTGSTKVRINNALPNRITGNQNTTDSSFLNLTGLAEVNLRLNGLNQRQANCGIPIGPPGDSSAAQTQVNGIDTMPYAVDATLIGAPVVNQTVAFIDYTQPLTLGSNCDGISVSGPHIDLFPPGDAAIPVSDLSLQLERFGNTVSTDGVTAGQRYWLRNVVFQHGNNVVADHQNAPDPFNFMFDTGTTITIVNDQMAGLLGLASQTASFSCFGGTDNGYVINSVTMLGTDGSYRIENASICWRESAIQSPQVVDAVIGSNFFDQVKILIDGPNDTLGILQ